jgi:hypothetical protein
MGRGPRKWVKVFCYEMLHGSVSYQLTEGEQAVWVKLLCFAGLCGNEGIIADHDLRPFPHEFICHEIHTDAEVFEATLAKCKEEGRISEDGQGIRITNWAKYQSEYDRQKVFRERWRNKGERQLGLSPEDHERINQENEERIAAFKSKRDAL